MRAIKKDSAGPPGNRWYLVEYAHPEDPNFAGDKQLLRGDPGFTDYPGHAGISWQHVCNVNYCRAAIVAYYKGDRRPGFGVTLDCEDPKINRCWFCNERFGLRVELAEHKLVCDTTPGSRSGTKAHGASVTSYVFSFFCFYARGLFISNTKLPW